MWNDDIRVTMQNYNRRHIHAIISMGRERAEWKFSSFYGHPEAAKRKELWALLRHLVRLHPTPWLCMGDFNEIVNHSEMWGAAMRARKQKFEFQKALEDCHLCDLGFKRPKYTWNSKKEGTAFTKERLDRAIATSEWCSMFSTMDVIWQNAAQIITQYWSHSMRRRDRYGKGKNSFVWKRDGALGRT
jgi:hypothetical protein